MLSSFNIGKRMGLAFATLVCLALALAASGYWGLSNVATTAEHILDVDVVAADTSGQVQASTLSLRRFEKDYFLNIADAKEREQYLEKWKAERQTLVALLDKLSATLAEERDKSKVTAMRNALSGYDEGFERVRDGILNGAITTPAQANHAVAPFKEHIRTLEANARIFRGET